jgi:GNAT superfamily N-acetyltransferase
MAGDRSGAARREVDASDEVLLDAVVASDRRYFALAAHVEPLPGATVLHLPGSAGVGAGTVVWVDDPEVVAKAPGWVDAATAVVRPLGAPVLRVYGLGPGGPAAEHCAAAGLVARRELAYVGESVRALGPRRAELRPATGDDGRRARRIVAGTSAVAPDGHPVQAEAFLAGEEQRAAAGGLDLFVAWEGDEPVAIVGAMRCARVLRMKNLSVRPDRRRAGWATAVTAALVDLAEEAGLSMATVALGGEPSEDIYRKLGMRVAGAYTEWSLPLGVDA